MKTKAILFATGLVIILSLYSFKSKVVEESPKIVLISILQGGGDNEGFIITYGDGKKETRPFKTKFKGLSAVTKASFKLNGA